MICEYATGATCNRSIAGAGERSPRSLSIYFFCLALALCLAFSAGCATVSTSIEKVWLDAGRPQSASIGKTLVLVLYADSEVVSILENEWVRQLRDQGIDAQALTVLDPDKVQPDKQEVIALVRAGGFQTLVVSRISGVKAVEREAPGSDVAVVETVFYDAATEKRFWTAEAHTFMHHPVSERRTEQRMLRAKDFVATLIAELSRSGVLGSSI